MCVCAAACLGSHALPPPLPQLRTSGLADLARGLRAPRASLPRRWRASSRPDWPPAVAPYDMLCYRATQGLGKVKTRFLWVLNTNVMTHVNSSME